MYRNLLDSETKSNTSMTGTKTVWSQYHDIPKNNGGGLTRIGNRPVLREQKPPQGRPVVDLEPQGSGLQRDDNLLRDAVLGVGPALVKGDVTHIGLPEMVVEVVLGGESLDASRAGKGAGISLDWGVMGANMFSEILCQRHHKKGGSVRHT